MTKEEIGKFGAILQVAKDVKSGHTLSHVNAASILADFVIARAKEIEFNGVDVSPSPWEERVRWRRHAQYVEIQVLDEPNPIIHAADGDCVTVAYSFGKEGSHVSVSCLIPKPMPNRG